MITKIKNTNIGIALSLACALTVLSQMPFITNGISSYISIGVWLVLTVFIILNRGEFYFNKLLIFSLIFAGAFVCYIGVMFLFNRQGYLETDLFRCIVLSTFMLFVGINSSVGITKKDVELFAITYLIMCFILGIVVYFTDLIDYDVAGSATDYVVSSKNSKGVILGTGIIIAFLYMGRKNIYTDIILFVLIGFFGILIALMKNRAVLVVMPIVAVLELFFAPNRKKLIIPIIAMVVGIILYFIIDSEAYDVFLKDILYAGQGDSLAESSSGRDTEWQNFFADFEKTFLVGDGLSKREALPLTAYLQYGAVIGTAVMIFAILPLCWTIKEGRITKNPYIFLLFMVALLYLSNSIFEQLSPFGPGGRCFFLWVMLGLLSGNKKLID